MISSFGLRTPNAFLSNFYVWPFDLNGRRVESAEHAFQASKTFDPAAQDLVLSAHDGKGVPDPGHAKRLGQRVRLRDDWEDVKVDVMRTIIEAKFREPVMQGLLLATGTQQLVEGNDWGDDFWGCIQATPGGVWVGSNWLGHLLMERRDILAARNVS